MGLTIRDLPLPFRMQPGLQRLGPHDQPLTAIDHHSPLGQARRTSAAQAFHVSPDCDVASLGNALHSLLERWGLPIPCGADFWRDLCMCVAEDLVFFDPASGHVQALLVCCPSHWRPEQVVGRHFLQIHQPVPDNDAIVRTAPALLKLLGTPQSWLRHVWSICPDPAWDRHPDRLQAGDGCHWTWRVEEQRFAPLADTGLCLMSIRLLQSPLAEETRHATDAAHLLQVLRSMSPQILDYKGLRPLLNRLNAECTIKSPTA